MNTKNHGLRAWTIQSLVGLALTIAIVLVVLTIAAHAQVLGKETPIYGADGKYQGSVHDYGKTQTYTNGSGQFNGSSINNGNGTTSFYGPNGNFTGSAGSSIDRAFNFKK
jgi:hypothetical protein